MQDDPLNLQPAGRWHAGRWHAGRRHIKRRWQEEKPLSFAFAALLIGNAALAFGPVFVRWADTGPSSSAFWRLALALPFLFFFAGRRGFAKVTRPVFAIAAIAGLFFAFDLASWHVGILYTSVTNATLFGNITSLLLVIIGLIAARRLPGKAKASAVILAFAGAALLMGQSYETSSQSLVGDLLCLLAGVLYTGFVLAMQHVRGQISNWSALFLSSLVGLPILLAVAVALGETIIPTDWTPVLLLALSSQVIGQGCMIYALPRFSTLVVGLSLLIQPAIAALSGWFWFDESLTPLDWVGALMVAAALVLIRLPDRRTKTILPK